jgi:hypothetical protein
MKLPTQMALSLVVCLLFASLTSGQESADKAQPKIEYRWMERVAIEGVTEGQEIAGFENPREHWFLHQKPIELSKEVNQKVAAELEENGSRRIAIVADGKYRGHLTIEKSSIKLYPDIFKVIYPPDADDGPKIKGELVGTKVIWDQAPFNFNADIVRFKDRWFVACCEKDSDHARDVRLRVISSKDGNQWESFANFKSLIQPSGFYAPAFNVTSEGQLLLTAYGVMPSLDRAAAAPVTSEDYAWIGWSSEDGATWSKPMRIGAKYTDFSRTAWNQNVAFNFVHGNSCGNAQTVRFLATQQFVHTEDGRNYDLRYEETFSGFFPENLSLVFNGDQAHCLMSRTKPDPEAKMNTWHTGMLGSSKAPYTDWRWKEINTTISHSNLLRLPDQRIIGVVGLTAPKSRVSICELDVATRKLKEVLELPMMPQFRVGFAHHDGHVWISYQATHNNKMCVHLAKVKLTQSPR